jgi:hypothetical protein
MRAAFPLASAAAFLVTAAACGRQPSSFKPVATVKQLMQATIDPSADVIFEAVGTVVTSSGVEEIAPKNDAEWANVRNHALTLAESGNLLMIGERARDREGWITFSQALVDAGRAAALAAEAKNPEALFEAGGRVYEVCQQCHNRYWQQAPDVPGR